MARKIELQVQLDGLDKINKDLDNMEQSLLGMKEELSGIDRGSEEFKKLSQSISDTEKRLQSFGDAAGEATTEQMTLNQALGEAEDELGRLALAGDTTSDKYKELVGEVGRLKKVQMETNMVTDNAAKGFTGKLTMGIQRVAAAYQVGMAATQMFGVESEKAQEVMARLQAVMAFTQGVEQLKQLTVGMKLFGQGGIAAMSGLQKAITATGIGALVVAVGLLVAYWDDIVSFIGGGVSEQEKLVETAKENVNVAQKQLEAFDNQTNQLRLQGKSEKEILLLRVEKINAIIKEQEIFIKTMEEKQKLEVAAAKRNQEITQAIIRGAIELSTIGLRLLVAPIDMILETANLVAEALGFDKISTTNLNKEITKLNENLAETASKFFFDPEAIAAEGQKAIDEQKGVLDKLKNDRDGILLQIKSIEKADAENSIKSAEERAAKLEELRRQELEIIKEISARKLAAEEAARDLELSMMEEGVEKQRLLLERQYGVERQALIDQSNAGEIQKLEDKFAKGQIKEEKYLEEIQKLRKDDSRLTDEERKLLLLKENEKNNKIIQLEKDAAQKKLDERKKFQEFLLSQETDARQREINAAQKGYDEDLAKLKEFLTNKSITQEEFDAAEKKRAEKLTEDLTEITDKYRNETLTRLQGGFSTIAKGFDMLRDGAAGLFGAIGSSLSSGLSGLLEIGKMKFDEFDTQLQNTAQKVNAYAQAIGGMIQSVLGAVSEEQKKRLEEGLERVGKIYDDEIALLEKQKQQGLLTEEQVAQRKYDIDLKRYNDEEKLRKDAFEKEKAMKIASAITSGLMGAVSAFAGAMQLGPIAGPIVGGVLAGIVGAMTAVNVAQIRSTKYEGGTAPSPPSGLGGVGGGVAGGGTTGAEGAPTPNITTLFGQPMTAGNQGGQQQEAGERQMSVRAYVLETDITTSQNTISTYEQRAEIG